MASDKMYMHKKHNYLVYTVGTFEEDDDGTTTVPTIVGTQRHKTENTVSILPVKAFRYALCAFFSFLIILFTYKILCILV